MYLDLKGGKRRVYKNNKVMRKTHKNFVGYNIREGTFNGACY